MLGRKHVDQMGELLGTDGTQGKVEKAEQLPVVARHHDLLALDPAVVPIVAAVDLDGEGGVRDAIVERIRETARCVALVDEAIVESAREGHAIESVCPRDANGKCLSDREGHHDGRTVERGVDLTPAHLPD